MPAATAQALSELLSRLNTTPGGTTGRWGDCTLYSHFQPIYSLSHMRLVGHEALLRAHNPQGGFMSPLDVFARCQDAEQTATCDRLSRLVHLGNYAAARRQGEWLFLNVHPNVLHLLALGDGTGYLHHIARHFGIACENMVLEVLESETADPGRFAEAMAMARQAGVLVAIDDFGAGHSNFDRVWRLQPDIVKLDRSLVARAATERRVQRVVSQMVSLLHECGAIVLMEGIETHAEALLALDCDADMVQGYFFGRPQAALSPPRHAPASLSALYGGLASKRQQQHKQRRAEVAPFLNAIGHAGMLLGVSRSMEEACSAFLDLPGAEVCYVLDANGYQLGHNLWSPHYRPDPKDLFEPLRETEGACWSRRPYFQRAIETINKVQITRPYRTLHGQHQCMTASMAFHCPVGGSRTEVRVVCGDVRWDETGPDTITS